MTAAPRWSSRPTARGSTARSSYTPSSPVTVNRFAIGAIFRFSSALAWFDGEISQIVIARGDVSLEDRRRPKGYLAHKWALAGALPSDHP